MRVEPVLSSAAWVAGSWWIVLTAFSVGSSIYAHGDVSWLPVTSVRLSMTLFGVAVGSSIAAILIATYRYQRKGELKPTKRHNTTVTLGQYPSYWTLNFIDQIQVPQERIDSALKKIHSDYPYLREWLKVETTFKPAFLDVLKAYLSRPNLVATTHAGFHGGITTPVLLIDHALAVANQALKIVPDFRYVGLKSRPKGMPTLNPRDPHYMPETFHEECPIGLIALSAFAHDIGKIKTFVEIKEGMVIEANGKHGPVGARLITHIPSVMLLHPNHIRALTSVLAHYHACHTLPLDRDYRTGENMIRDDKTVAIMEIVIEADKAVCAKEAASVTSLSDYESDSLDFSIENTDEIIWSSLYIALAPSSDRKHINGGHEERIGFKYQDKLFLIEEALNKAALSNLGNIQPPGDKGGVNALTEAILNSFEKRGLLCKEWEGAVTVPTQAIFKVLFVQPPEMVEKQGLRKPKMYQRMIIINAKSQYFDFSHLPDSPMIPSIEAPTLGKHRAKQPTTNAPKSQPSTKPSAHQKTPNSSPTSTPSAKPEIVVGSLEFNPDSFLQTEEPEQKKEPSKGKRNTPQRKNSRSGVPVKEQLVSAEGGVTIGLSAADLRSHIPAIQVVLGEIFTKGEDKAVIQSKWENKPCLMTRLEKMPAIYPAIEWQTPVVQDLLYKTKTSLILHKNSAGKIILVVLL